MKKGIAVLALLTIALRLAVLAGNKDETEEWLRRLSSVSLSVELGTREDGETTEATPAPPAWTNAPTAAALPQESPDAAAAPGPTDAPAPEPSSQPVSSDGEDGDDPEILPTTIAGGVTIRNNTGYEPDLAQLLAEGMELTLPAEGVQILIVHTHGSEAYTPDSQDRYEASDGSRTEDKNYNVIRVGDELAEALESYGLTVTHDREIYDYPSYTGSYNRSGAAVQAHLAEHPETAIVIDLHRDALGTKDVIYKTVAALDGEASSQVMLVVGTGENGLEHPLWEENLKRR